MAHTRLAQTQMNFSTSISKNESKEEVVPDFSEYFDFSGRIITHPPGSFQYRWGRKVSPADLRIFVRKYKLND